MVQDDSSAAAIKGDIQMIVHTINDLKELMLAQDEMLQMQISNLPTKEDLAEFATKEDIKESENHMIAVMEEWRHDFVGIHKDKISQHEDRIAALELVTGIKG
jgi:hypothetical protein